MSSGIPQMLRGLLGKHIPAPRSRPVEKTRTGYRLTCPSGGSVTMCLHPDATTFRHTDGDSHWFERTCPDCPARSICSDLLGIAMEPWFTLQPDGTS